MYLASQIISRLWGLPKATNNVAVERDLKVPMPDGTILRADHYAPIGAGWRPTIVVGS